MVIVHVMQMPVVKIVDVTIVLDCNVSAVGAVNVGVTVVFDAAHVFEL